MFLHIGNEDCLALLESSNSCKETPIAFGHNEGANTLPYMQFQFDLYIDYISFLPYKLKRLQVK